MVRPTASSSTKRKEIKKPVCAKCGAEINIGDWPWCPHVKLKASRFLWNWVK